MPPEVIIYVLGLCLAIPGCGPSTAADRAESWKRGGRSVALADQLKRGPMALWLAENASFVGKSRSQVIAQLGPPAREWLRAAYVIEWVSGFPFGSRRRLFEIEFDVESGRVIESRVALQ